MNTLSSITTKIEKRKQSVDKSHNAFSAVLAIAQMDPHSRTDLITYLKALNECQAAGDIEEQEYLADAILEVFQINAVDNGSDIDSWERDVKDSDEGRKAAKELQEETDRFFKAYLHHKARCGLSTIRAVAKASGLVPQPSRQLRSKRSNRSLRRSWHWRKPLNCRMEL